MRAVEQLARQVLERVVAASPGADVEVSADHSRPALTRFANSVIHQNVAEESVRVGIRVHVAGRTASASSTVVGETGLDGAGVARPRRGRPGAARRRLAGRRATGPARRSGSRRRGDA